MNRRPTGLIAVFSLLLAVSAGGILVHYLTGYDYPASPAFDFEMNVLNDLVEIFFIVPVGLAGLWALRKGSAWGPVLIGATAANFAYNYGMMAAGRQNLWVFVWAAKIALGGTATCLVWDLLPAGTGHRRGRRIGAAIYLAVVLLAFTKMMGQRLLASALGQTMEMTMQSGGGAVDWGEPILRDPIMFFVLLLPVVLAAILGLLRDTAWGSRAAALSCGFIVMMVGIILLTGPLKEFLQKGAVSAAVWQMSAIMVAAAAPGVWTLTWLSGGGDRAPDRKAVA